MKCLPAAHKSSIISSANHIVGCAIFVERSWVGTGMFTRQQVPSFVHAYGESIAALWKQHTDVTARCPGRWKFDTNVSQHSHGHGIFSSVHAQALSAGHVRSEAQTVSKD